MAVQRALEAAGVQSEIQTLPSSTRTAKAAAESLGCGVAQIAKSIVFKASDSGQAVLVVASGVNRIDEAAVAELLGEPIERATPEFVREKTGFAIGGVAPCGHAEPVTVLIDEDLLDLAECWAAAGTPHSVFRLEPHELAGLTSGRVAAVKA